MPKELLFSGIQPTGTIHIGNYFGAIRNWIALQEKYECIYAIVDLHALTIDFDPAKMRERIVDCAATLLAAGIDPAKCRLFVQSEVWGHTELCWYFTTVCNFGSLERMTQFKEKSKQNADNINAGLFVYPVLQAADILLYKAKWVPVGEDQVQHIELTREIARKFNLKFGEVFPEAKELLTPTARIRGLDGEAKMSKSLGNHISLTEEAEDLRAKVMPAKTDENRKRRSDPGNPEVCNIYSYHRLFSPPDTVARVAGDCRSAAIGCVDCKKELLANMESLLGPIRERKRELMRDPATVEGVLETGAAALRPLAAATLEECRRAMGLWRPR